MDKEEQSAEGLQAYLTEFYAASTVKMYTRDINAYLSNCPGAEKATHKAVAVYVGLLRQRYSNVARIRAVLCAIKAYYSYLCHTGRRADNPTTMIRLQYKANHAIQLQDLFTAEEMEVMLEREEPYKKNIYRNRVLMSLLIYQGLWSQEVAGLRVEDIDLKAATVRIRATSKSAARTLDLKAGQVLMFYEYINNVRPGMIKEETETDRLLIGLQGRALPAWAVAVHVRRCYGKMYPGRTVSPGTIRQSVIANLLKAGHDISVVQLFAGHLLTGSTQRYQQSGVDTLQAAVEQYHPLQ